MRARIGPPIPSTSRFISRAAWHASTAWFSSGSGAPQIAMIASPMYLLIMPLRPMIASPIRHGLATVDAR